MPLKKFPEKICVSVLHSAPHVIKLDVLNDKRVT
jgi:hypothetical protein